MLSELQSPQHLEYDLGKYVTYSLYFYIKRSKPQPSEYVLSWPFVDRVTFGTYEQQLELSV